MIKKILIISSVIIFGGVLLLGYVKQLKNVNQQIQKENDDNYDNFYKTGINLTFQNRNNKFESLDSLKGNKTCEYEELSARCNILMITSEISHSFGNFGVGNENSYNEEKFRTEFNSLLEKLKNNNIRIIQTIPELNEIVIELKDDKNISLIKKDIDGSEYFYVSYDMLSSFD